jgi:hypothetical protein
MLGLLVSLNRVSCLSYDFSQNMEASCNCTRDVMHFLTKPAALCNLITFSATQYSPNMKLISPIWNNATCLPQMSWCNPCRRGRRVESLVCCLERFSHVSWDERHIAHIACRHYSVTEGSASKCRHTCMYECNEKEKLFF